MQLRDYQSDAIDATYDWFRNGKGNPLIVAPTGCHDAGTLILMFDGSSKPVEDVSVGDQVMGPDSTPRTVLRLCRGRDEMYRITPKKGDPFVVNANHVLALKATGGAKMGGIEKGDITCLTVSEYLEKSKTWKHIHKLHRTGVTFPRRDIPTLDPYTIGAMIGDGCLLYSPSISNPDHEVLNAVTNSLERFGVKFHATPKTQNITNWDVSFTGSKGSKNPIAKALDDLGLWGKKSGEKFIPDDCKFGDVYTRMQVLAGLLDTDGHLSKGYFDFVSKSRQLAEDVTFVSRSLGFAAYVKQCEKSCQTGFTGTYWRVLISGNVNQIPTKVARKQAKPRKQIKDALVTGFGIEPLGVGEFFGFTLDKDHLYLTSDFTVHHNSGKSLILSEFIRRAVSEYEGTRIICATHVRELIAQNFQALKRLWPQAPAGIYSAGLNKRQTSKPVTFVGIQSVAKRAADFGYVDLLIVDECHLIPRNSGTMYQKFIEGLKDENPQLKVIGLTATPFRLDSGRLDQGPGSIFDGIAYDIPVSMLVDRGYLSPLVSKSPSFVFDTKGLHTRGGDWIEGEMNDRFNTDEVTRQAVEEIMQLGHDRKSWLLFCISVDHAQNVCDELTRRGIPSACVTGKTSSADRDRILRDYKSGKLRAVTNVGVLTTGFDAPATDLLAFLRPTQSLSLYMQMAGRAMRIAPGKENGLVLDYAGNVARHGPVDAINVQSAPGRAKDPNAEKGEAPAKTCPNCKSIILISAMECPDCGHLFPPPEPKIDREASTEAIMNMTAEDHWQVVQDFAVFKHVKSGTASLRVEYLVGGKSIKEWVCLEHTGFPRQKAVQWWTSNAGTTPPDTVDEAIARQDEIRIPAEVATRREGKYTRIHRMRGFKSKVDA